MAKEQIVEKGEQKARGSYSQAAPGGELQGQRSGDQKRGKMKTSPRAGDVRGGGVQCAEMFRSQVSVGRTVVSSARFLLLEAWWKEPLGF